MYKLYFWIMIVILWKNTYSYKRHTQTEQLSLGRRLLLLLIGIIGISRDFQTFTVELQTFSYLYELSFKTMSRLSLQVLQIKDTLILMNSPASWLILAFKITCILRSQIDRYDDQVLWKRSSQDSSFYFDYSLCCLILWRNTLVIKIILLMQWMMLLLVY